MDLDRYLTSVQLLDCHGRVTHHLTLQLDGTVSVRLSASTVTVIPATRSVMPPSARLGAGEYSHEQVVSTACDLASGRYA